MTTEVTATNGKKKGGRPRIDIDLNLLKGLAVLQCTQDEMVVALRAAGTKMDVRTLKRRLEEPRYREVVDAGQAEGRVSIRREMFRKMRLMNSAGVTMNIHLAKHHLGQTEKSLLELSGRIDSKVEVSSARERTFRKLDALSERIARRVDGIAAEAGARSSSERVD